MNSKLAKYKWRGRTSNYNWRDRKISGITPHHQAGNLTCEQCANVLQGHGGSVNYMIQTNGIIGVMIDERFRAWTSSNRENDMRCVTIEVANDTGANGSPAWHVSDKALAALIDLCTDICRRNGFRLNYTGDPRGNLTMHRWFAPTGCPGDYLASKFPYIAREVNRRLDAVGTVEIKPKYSHTKKAIRINWERVEDASGYRVYRYDKRNKKWQNIATVGRVTTFRDSGLRPGTEYRYKVKAFKRLGGKVSWGKASDTFKAVTK